MEGVCREHTLFRLQFTAFWDFGNKKLFNPRPVPPNTEVFSYFQYFTLKIFALLL